MVIIVQMLKEVNILGLEVFPRSDNFLFCVSAVGRDASLVCGCLPSKCEKWCYHVSLV